MAPTIRIDDGVYNALKRQAEPFTDTPNDVLRRLLNLDDEPPSTDDQGQIDDPVILVRITKSFMPGISAEALYKATRYAWKVGTRREAARFALAVSDGTVREVYEIHRWRKALPRSDGKWPGERWEFDGAKASETVRSKYVGLRVDSYFPAGAQNPVKYVNC